MYVGLSEANPSTGSHNYGTTNPRTIQNDKPENQGRVKELANKFSVSLIWQILYVTFNVKFSCMLLLLILL